VLGTLAAYRGVGLPCAAIMASTEGDPSAIAALSKTAAMRLRMTKQCAAP
jgi:hypothetical protein